MELTLQNMFYESYVATLRDKIKCNINTDDYYKEEFPYDKSKVKPLKGIYQPNDLIGRMDAHNELQSAKALYEAYEDIPLSLASDEKFWIYLTHVDLFNYVQERWLKNLKKKATNDYIYKHWFYNEKGIMQTTLMGLWWAVHCSIDKSRGSEHKYDLTDTLFISKDFQVRFGSSVLFRHKEAVIGILDYLYENPKIFSESTKRRGQYIMKYFNVLGAVKELAYFDRDYFKSEMSKIKNDLLSIKAATDEELDGIDED